MKKIIILIPVFNDWESLEKLIVEINENIKELKKIDIECLVINDASTINQPKLSAPRLSVSVPAPTWSEAPVKSAVETSLWLDASCTT